MELDDVADDGEPEAEAAVRSRRGRVSLPEAIEYIRQQVRRHALTGIGDLDHGIRADTSGRHGDRAASWRELDRV